jgi:hypothetical protein
MSLGEAIIDAVIDGQIGHDGVVTRQEVIRYFRNYPKSYTGVILSNSETHRDHSPTYETFTQRIGTGRYRIHPEIIAQRRAERGLPNSSCKIAKTVGPAGVDCRQCRTLIPADAKSARVISTVDHWTTMNSERFLTGQRRYFEKAYEEFRSFGGPSVYFHERCLEAAKDEFLSVRHVEMLYATLASWGMHRMGDPDATKTKLTDWDQFHDSVMAQRTNLEPFRGFRMLGLSEREYSEAVVALKSHYGAFKLSVSAATVVVNSKALFHIFPEFIPPIDRQYTVRFFEQPPERWRDSKGKFRMVNLPSDFEGQFDLFRKVCVGIKRLADQIEPEILESERLAHGVTAPKALDNAIVNYVKIVSKE